MESSHERVKVKFSYSSVAFVAIVSSLTITIIHGPQECQTLSLSQTFSVPQSHREIVWNFHAITYTNLLLRGSLLFNFISGSPIIMPMPNSSVDPNFAEIAWQGDTTGGNNDTSSTSSSLEDSSEPTSKIVCASSTSCTSQSSSSQNESRIVRKMKSEKEKLRLELLKQIKSLDHMKCFPKVLCGLSVDSSKTSTGIDSHLVRSYIQLMRTAKPEDDSSEESKPSLDSTKDALSLFLMKSGILPAKKKRRKDASISASSSASASEEDEEEEDDPFSLEDQQTTPYKSSIERKNEQLKEFLKLSKRKLAISDDFDGLDSFTPRNHTYINPLEFSHQKGYTRPVVYMSSGQSANGNSDGGESETSSITGQIGSLVSSWVPWVSLSFGADSFEKDPFFSGGKSKKATDINEQIRSQSEAWKELDKLTYLMKLKKEIEWKKAKLKKRKLGRMNDESHDESDDHDLPRPHEIADGEYADYGGEDYITSGRLSRDLKASADSEIVIYSTAVEIGKKLKDPRQCDYLYNGCPVSYAEILKIITSIRKDIKEEDETTEMLTKEMVDYLPSRTKVTQNEKQKHTVASLASAVAAAKNKMKTQSKSQRTRNKPHLKQQQKKHNVQPVRNDGKKQTAQHQQQSPITKISHILPNGEKVEINVQLSGNVDAYASNVGEDDTEIQADTEAEEEIGEVEYLEDEESLFDEESEDDGNTLTQGEVVEDSPEDPAISASYELDDEKQDGDDFRKPTPLEIFNKISLNGVQITSTTSSPKPKYKVTKPRPTTRRPVSTKRPKPKPKPTTSPTAATTERRPTWSKGTTKRPTTVKTARPTPRAPPAVNKLKPLMQSYIHSSSIEDDESSLESNVKKVTSARPVKSKPSPTKPVVSSNKAKSTSKPNNVSPPNKRNSTKISRPSKRPATTTPKPTSLSPNSSSKTSVPRRKKPTKRPAAISKSTSKPKVTTSRYKVSKQPTHSSTGNNETNAIFPAASSSSRNHTKTRNKVSPTRKPGASLAHSTDTKSPQLKRKPDRKPSGTTPIIMTTSTALTTTLPPLAMFTKSVMDDVIQEFYHKKHIHFPIPSESPPTTGTNLNGKKKHSQDIGINGMMGSQLVQIGGEGSSATPGDESFISIETEASGELKLHSGKKKQQLGGSGGVAADKTEGATGDDPKLFTSIKDDSLSKSKRTSGENSSLESSSKKRIKYKNPKLPHLVILNSSSLDSPNIPNPILTSAERGTTSGSGMKSNKGYTVSNKKPNSSKVSGNPLELPPYVFDSYSPDNPYRPR